MNRRTLMKLVGASGWNLAADVTADQEAPAKRVLVLGGTGRTGVRLVQELLATGQRVRVLKRSVDRARLAFDKQVEIVASDVREAATLSPALLGVSGVISAIGLGGGSDRSYLPEQADYHGIRNLVAAAKGHSLEHVVLVSAMGVTQPDHGFQSRWR